jgi:predicted alpha/beta-fold hydrolase
MNRLPRFYHHATVEDLDFVVQTVLKKGFDEVYLMGFSLGAAQILNYFGRFEIDKKIKAGVAVSAPVQLKSCSEKLKIGFNRIYLNVFTRKLKKKFQEKAQVFPNQIDTSKINSIRTFDEVDEYFTAPLHGFENKDDYYEKASPGYSIEKIKTPVLIINALDDPFLGKDCYPFEFAKENEFVFLETPKHGGHCAFPLPGSKFSWTDFRAYEFFNSEITSKGF